MKVTAATNSTYNKLAVQWLDEHLSLVSSSMLVDSSSPKSPTSCSYETLGKNVKLKEQGL